MSVSSNTTTNNTQVKGDSVSNETLTDKGESLSWYEFIASAVGVVASTIYSCQTFEFYLDLEKHKRTVHVTQGTFAGFISPLAGSSITLGTVSILSTALSNNMTTAKRISRVVTGVCLIAAGALTLPISRYAPCHRN